MVEISVGTLTRCYNIKLSVIVIFDHTVHCKITVRRFPLHVVGTKKSIKENVEEKPRSGCPDQTVSVQTRIEDRWLVDFQSIHAEKEVSDSRSVYLCIFVGQMLCRHLNQKQVWVILICFFFRCFHLTPDSQIAHKPCTCSQALNWRK